MGFLSIAMLTSVALSAPRIAVIGGGASGIFSGIAAAESCSAGAVTVEILEATRETLKKVSISGGGRVRLVFDFDLYKSFPLNVIAHFSPLLPHILL
jgi:predicted flavoprotein YhiN